jgi:hypothetical protein
MKHFESVRIFWTSVRIFLIFPSQEHSHCSSQCSTRRKLLIPLLRICSKIFKYGCSVHADVGWAYIAKGWNRSVAIATGYAWMVRVRILAVPRDFSLLHSVQTDSEDHPASYPMCTGCSFHGAKRPELRALISIYCRVHDWWSLTSSCVFMA